MITEKEIPLAKVLKPSAEEFNSFEDFVETLDHDKTFQNYGAVKVILHFLIFLIRSRLSHPQNGRQERHLTQSTSNTWSFMPLLNKTSKESLVKKPPFLILILNRHLRASFDPKEVNEGQRIQKEGRMLRHSRR